MRHKMSETGRRMSRDLNHMWSIRKKKFTEETIDGAWDREIFRKYWSKGCTIAFGHEE